MDTLIPTLDENVPTSCSSSPTLPTGISIDNTTCTISGTPTTAQDATDYTITVTNENGSNSDTITMDVGNPPEQAYASSPYLLEQFDPATLTATFGGDQPYDCSIDPTLPDGLTMNDSTCDIMGTPTTIQGAIDYTITAGNDYGSSQTTLSIEVITDSTPPSVLSTSPDDTETDVAPNQGTITVVFDDAMNTAFTPTLTTEAYNGTAWVAVPNTGTTFNWNDSNTLKIELSWIQFPENTQLRWSLGSANLKDNSENGIAGDVQQTFSTTSRNTYVPIADTGQTDCYNTTTTIPCGDGTYPGQDGDYTNTPNARSFTGPTQHADYPDDYTTTDNVTGLVWKTCTEGQSGSDCATGSAGTMTWYDAVNQCAALNTANSGAGYAGRTDWRLPTPAELGSLPDYGVNNPAIDLLAFPQTVLNFYLAASTSAYTSFSADPADTWGTHFSVGFGNFRDKTTNSNVRCISSSSSGEQSLTDNGNSTISDMITGLVWQKCSYGQSGLDCSGGGAATRTWTQALLYCDGLDFAGITDWRLPSVNELKSLILIQTGPPFIDQVIFPETVPSEYWSSSTYTSDISTGWYILFGANSVLKNSKSNDYYVRCVTTGP